MRDIVELTMAPYTGWSIETARDPLNKPGFIQWNVELRNITGESQYCVCGGLYMCVGVEWGGGVCVCGGLCVWVGVGWGGGVCVGRGDMVGSTSFHALICMYYDNHILV